MDDTQLGGGEIVPTLPRKHLGLAGLDSKEQLGWVDAQLGAGKMYTVSCNAHLGPGVGKGLGNTCVRHFYKCCNILIRVFHENMISMKKNGSTRSASIWRLV